MEPKPQGNELALRSAASVGAIYSRSDAAPDRIDFRGFIALFRRRLLMFSMIVANCLLLALLFTMQTPDLYSATADVVMKEPTSSVTPEAAQAESPQRSERIDTELEQIKSRDLAGKVFDGLKLSQDRDFMRQVALPNSVTATILRMFHLPGATEKPFPSAAEARESAIDTLVANLDTSRIDTAFAMHIVYSDTDPERATRIANGYASIYTNDQISEKRADNNKAIRILKSRMEDLRQQAQADFGAVQAYRIRNNLLSANGTQLTEQEISTYNQQVALNRAEAAHDQAELETARRQLASGTGAVGEAQASPVVQALREQRAQISVQIADLASRYRDGHPELAKARRQLADIDEQIRTEVTRVLFALSAKAQASAQRLASVEGSLGSARSTLATNNSAMVRLDDLDRKAQASQALYESYLSRYKEQVAQAGAEQSDSRLLSSARIPTKPSSPNIVLNLLLGLLVGTVLGAGGAVLAETNFGGLTNGDEVERRLGVPYFGGVPLLASIEPRSATPMKTVADYPGGPFAESLRSLLAALRQCQNSRNQVIAICSAVPDEGKTTITSCLARVAGMSGERVAVIDCDAIRGTLSRQYELPQGTSGDRPPGLRELLRGDAAIEDVGHIDSVGKVTLLGVTTPFSEGERLMEKGKLNRLVARLREQFDLILLDCAPLLPIAETREIATIADNVVVVARWRKSTDTLVRTALKLLSNVNPGTVGIVLNSIDMRKRVRFGDSDPIVFYHRYQDYRSEK